MTRTIRQCVDFGECGEKYVDFEVDYRPYRPAKGMFGPWEHAQPEEPAEVDIVGATIGGNNALFLFDAEALRLFSESLLKAIAEEDREEDIPDYYRDAA